MSRVDDTATEALPARTARAEQTRALILDTALHMFRESGYEATTMRAIAQKAGVATGNAYYYFASKDELIGEFYARLVTEQASASRRVLVPPHLRERLPETLWLAATGVSWFWTHDRSPKFRRTYRLIEAVAALAGRLVRLSRLPVLRSFTRQLTAALDAARG